MGAFKTKLPTKRKKTFWVAVVVAIVVVVVTHRTLEEFSS